MTQWWMIDHVLLRAQVLVFEQPLCHITYALKVKVKVKDFYFDWGSL